MSTESLLKERGKTHGDFGRDAFVAQTIKQVIYSIHNDFGQGELTDVQRQSIDMIASKLGRIASGDPNHRDHWEDIAGYARLAAKELPGEKQQEKVKIASGLTSQQINILQLILESRFSPEKVSFYAESTGMYMDFHDLYVILPCQD